MSMEADPDGVLKMPVRPRERGGPEGEGHL